MAPAKYEMTFFVELENDLDQVELVEMMEGLALLLTTASEGTILTSISPSRLRRIHTVAPVVDTVSVEVEAEPQSEPDPEPEPVA